MKKLLQISKYLYPYFGGTEQVALDFSDALKNENIKQKIICFNEDASDGEYVCRRKETVYDKVFDIDVVRCGYFAKISSQSLSLTYAKELKKIMDNFLFEQFKKNIINFINNI